MKPQSIQKSSNRRTSCVLAVCVTAMLVTLSITAIAQSKNEVLTTAAWRAFETNNFQGAITNAQQCIEDFEERANAIQSDLKKEGASVPTGKPASEKVKEEISARGPLNDVGTCYFIIGEANRELAKTDKGKITDARKAYEAARKLTYARCWDTNGWFWEPSVAASDRLRRLPPGPSKVR